MLRGKSAIVTGSTSGIGLGIAQALAAAGANVMLNGLGDAVHIEQVRAAMAEKHATQILYDAADMRNPAQIGDMVARAQQEFGALEILVNNAGIQFVSPVDQFPDEQWEAILAINLTSSFHTIKHALPGMKARGWGRIVNIASVHGLVASPFKSAYVAAKHGLVGLTKVVALESAETGVTCNAICPGFTRTPLVEKQIQDQARAHNISEEQAIREIILSVQPTRRFVEIEQLGGLAVFLCSPAAASITGASLPIDGGWTAR